jgi:hypothetical protein
MRATTAILLLALAGCAPQNPAPMQSALPAMFAGYSAGSARNCIPASRSTGISLIDDNHAIVRDGGTIWVSQLRAPCNADNGLRTIVIDVHGGNYCRNDAFRLADATSTIPGPSCFLGDWIPYRRGR